MIDLFILSKNTEHILFLLNIPIGDNIELNEEINKVSKIFLIDCWRWVFIRKRSIVFCCNVWRCVLISFTLFNKTSSCPHSLVEYVRHITDHLFNKSRKIYCFISSVNPIRKSSCMQSQAEREYDLTTNHP